MNSVTDRCPWCDTVISRDKFKEIESKIRNQEQKRMAETEAAMRQRFDVERQALERKLKAESDQKASALSAELTRTLELLKKAEADKTAIREEAIKETNSNIKEAREKELSEQRRSLEKARDAALAKQRAESTKEREALEKKITELGKQLQRKNAQEEETLELDLFEDLQLAFPQDRIAKLYGGSSNEKILHEVLYKGRPCGRIVIDSRHRQAWQHGLVMKLRSEQASVTADHAILSTTVFPRGRKELCIEEGVIVVNPGQVIHIIELLRGAMVRMHLQGLSVVDRSVKTNRLYEFITSQEYIQKTREAASLTEDLLKLDVQEVKDHQTVWKKRGAMATKLKNILREVDAEIGAVLEGPATGEQPTSEITNQRQLRRVP